MADGLSKEASNPDVTEHWGPYSAHAYGPHAVYIPNRDEDRAFEIILVVTQEYPRYHTHPATDYWHGYAAGAERYLSSYDMRVLAWHVDPAAGYWSYLCLPEMNDSVQVRIEFLGSSCDALDARIGLINESGEDCTFKIDLYLSPNWTGMLPGVDIDPLKPRQATFQLADRPWAIEVEGLSFSQVIQTSSSNWVTFPDNIESRTIALPQTGQDKHRIRATMASVEVEANESLIAQLHITTGARATAVQSTRFKNDWPAWRQENGKNRPYVHLWQETLHNVAYVPSPGHAGYAVAPIPSPQFGRYFIWDAGMTCLAAVEQDAEYAERCLRETPDPAIVGDAIYEKFGAFVPTQIFAWWELYCLLGDRSVLERHYGLMWRLLWAFCRSPYNHQQMPSLVRTRNNRVGVDDYPVIIYCSGEPFVWQYSHTIPVNADRTLRAADQPYATAIGIRCAKLVRLAAHVLDRHDDVEILSDFIDDSERSLNAFLWDDGVQAYAWRTAEDGHLSSMLGLDACFPLFSCSVPDSRREAVLDRLTQPVHGLWTRHGVTMVPINSPYFREDGYWNGSVWIPPQWIIWKALYSQGEMGKADELSSHVLNLIETSYAQTQCFWEHYRVANGKGGGAARFTGLTAPVLTLQAARRTPGRVQHGHDLLVDGTVGDSLRRFAADVRAPFGPVRSGVSVVLKPNTTYEFRIDGTPVTEIQSDAWGYISLTIEGLGKNARRIDINQMENVLPTATVSTR